MLNIKNVSIAVIGLGYVGLPLAIAFAKKYQGIKNGHAYLLKVIQQEKKVLRNSL